MNRYVAVLVVVVALAGCLPKKPFGQVYYIESLPPEAEVWSLGVMIGKTPFEIELSPGTQLSIQKEGFQEESVDTSQAQAKLISVRLKKLHEIKLNYMPEGSEVWESGNLLGKTPFVLKRVSGPVKLLVRHEFHKDQVDEFEVDGDTYRIKSLDPSVRYFPNTVCIFSSEPKGASVEHWGVENGSIVSGTPNLGTTLFEKPNSELFKISGEHLFVFRKEGFSPAVLTGKGSFSAHIMLDPARNYLEPSGKWFSTLDFKAGEIASPDKAYTLFALQKGSKFSVISKKGELEVDILDMKTDFSDVSGAAWADSRFFVVRGKNPLGFVFFYIYDAQERKRFRIENAGFWHEAEIAGNIEWNLRVPIKPSQIDTFADIRIAVQKNYSVASFRLYSGMPVEFIVSADEKFSSCKLVDCLAR